MCHSHSTTYKRKFHVERIFIAINQYLRINICTSNLTFIIYQIPYICEFIILLSELSLIIEPERYKNVLEMASQHNLKSKYYD